MNFYVEKIKKYNVDIDDDGYEAFENVYSILTNLINTMRREGCRTITCFDSAHCPIQYDIDELEEFNNKLLEFPSIFEIST